MAELFYVMGASGVGKDSLLGWVRGHLPHHAKTVFAHRYITRTAHAGGENHVALTETEFDRRLQLNCFAMHWYSHGLHYGIGVEINQWLALGLNVVINGSRAYLDQALQRYPRLIPVLIIASEASVRQRLVQRGRESGEEVEQRLQRSQVLEQRLSHPKMVRIFNEGALEDAGNQLLDILGGVPSPQSA